MKSYFEENGGTFMKTPSLIQFNVLRRLAGRGGKLKGQGG